ncbi:MAG: polyprenyl synthetase family protein [Dehalococcoidia bacterium]|nr:polyprenyl synthetase family protein [Dehalococcoidia bacterium]
MASLASAPPPLLLKHRDAIEAALRAAIGSDSARISAAARYVLGWEDEAGRPAAGGGKRIRPALCLFAAELFGADAAVAMPGAVAVEIVHNFSLVHDEVQDHDAERHGRPTLWARLGEGQAINAGDYLYTRAIAALSAGPGDASLRLAALNVLQDAIQRMIRGQWEDIAFESRLDVGVDEYLAMVAGKTGALLGAPLEIGALLAGAAPTDAAVLGRWGVQVGLAFQAQDDYLGTWGDPGETGKSNVNDIARRKKTLPVVYGLSHPASKDAVAAAYTKAGELTSGDIAAVVAALDAAGAAEDCRARARQYAEAAEALLESLSLDEARRAQLREVADYLVDRRS